MFDPRVLALLSCLWATSLYAQPTSSFSALLDEIWQYELSVSPLLATSMGEHRFDDRLKDLSPENLKQQDTRYRAFMQRLDSIEPTSLSRSEQITLHMQKRRLQNYIDQYAFKAHYVPLTSEYGFHSALAVLPSRAKFRNEKDYENYLTRLASFPTYFAQQLHWMKLGMSEGMVQPKVVMQGFEDSIAGYFNTEVEDSPFYAPLNKLDQLGLPTERVNTMKARAKRIIGEQVFTAYHDFYAFMQNTYIPQAKSDIASKTWPNGEQYYQNRAFYYTTTRMSADEIHQVGIREVARIREEMKDVMASLAFEGELSEFIAFLRNDPQFYAKTAEELIQYASYVSKQMDAKLPALFRKLPRTPYGVAPVPDSIAPKYTTGRYIAPTRDDQPGYYWVNTYALDKRPLYAIPALTLHEAVPGHHLQISLAREMDELPPVRRYTYISAFGEGWGLYSEYLGKEVGIYKTPYEEFGRLSYEMWRACRLVVDTGMHLKGWSREKALNYMLDNTALSEHNVRTEIDRYISWPAQALSYKIGEIEIRRLRQTTEQALGSRFDIRTFHDKVLEHGSVPLSILKENISAYIRSESQ